MSFFSPLIEARDIRGIQDACYRFTQMAVVFRNVADVTSILSETIGRSTRSQTDADEELGWLRKRLDSKRQENPGALSNGKQDPRPAFCRSAVRTHEWSIDEGTQLGLQSLLSIKAQFILLRRNEEAFLFSTNATLFDRLTFRGPPRLATRSVHQRSRVACASLYSISQRRVLSHRQCILRPSARAVSAN